MDRIRILDCTLRDGGYCNEWKFGNSNILKIIKYLEESNIDIIECGYLVNNDFINNDTALYKKVNDIDDFISDEANAQHVAMINYGEYDHNNIVPESQTYLSGIRIAFHKKDYLNALDYCKKIKEKGYKIYIQPMLSLDYSETEFFDLIKHVNEINPEAFYIVDSYGNMRLNDLMRMFFIADNNLAADICIGYHAHNNLQLAYSNALSFVSINTSRKMIVDTSTYGMGRGAGNLNTELFIDCLNEKYKNRYNKIPLLRMIDEVLNYFYHKNRWGYSLPNYLSAINNCHPNYASFLDEKNKLTVEQMNTIFSMFSVDKKTTYDEKYVMSLYKKYMNGKIAESDQCELQEFFYQKNVLIICPGKSIIANSNEINDIINQDNIISISVNFDYKGITDYVFVNNPRRRKLMSDISSHRVIATSNISDFDSEYICDYGKLLNGYEGVEDNAGLMLIKLLVNLKVHSIFIAGMDGYSYNSRDNYYNESMELFNNIKNLDLMNIGMKKFLEEYSKIINIKFITTGILKIETD